MSSEPICTASKFQIKQTFEDPCLGKRPTVKPGAKRGTKKVPLVGGPLQPPGEAGLKSRF